MTPGTFRQDVKSGCAAHSEFPDINRNMIGVYFTRARDCIEGVPSGFEAIGPTKSASPMT
jgi:hypothetical protein